MICVDLPMNAAKSSLGKEIFRSTPYFAPHLLAIPSSMRCWPTIRVWPNANIPIFTRLAAETVVAPPARRAAMMTHPNNQRKPL